MQTMQRANHNRKKLQAAGAKRGKMRACKGAVTLCNISCNLSHNGWSCCVAVAWKLGNTVGNGFVRLFPQSWPWKPGAVYACTSGRQGGTLRDKLQKWVLHCATPLKSLQKVELDSTFCNGSCNLSRNDFGRCKYVTLCNLFRATCLATPLRDKLHETLHSVTAS